MRTAKFFNNLLLLGFISLSCISIVYIFTKTQTPGGAIDFHSYWYAGLFIRGRSDPYQAYLANDTPQALLSFIDQKGAATRDLAQPGLARVPANTTPLVLILSTLSFFSWPVAKNIWLIFNYAFMFAIPGLVLKNIANPKEFSTQEKLISLAIFVSLFGTRNVATTGQTSLLVFLCMLAALRLADQDSWLLSGILLGIALSKYSLALPVFILMILQKRFRVVLVSVSVQLMGVLCLAFLTHNQPIQILSEYYQIMRVHLGHSGIHLAGLFPHQPVISYAAILAVTLGLIVMVWEFIKPAANWYPPIQSFIKLKHHIILVILTIWTLLIAYHKAYDTLVIILFLDAGFYLGKLPDKWQASQAEKFFLWVILAISTLIYCLPASGINMLQGKLTETQITAWIGFHNHLITITLVLILAYSVWLFRKHSLSLEKKPGNI